MRCYEPGTITGNCRIFQGRPLVLHYLLGVSDALFDSGIFPRF